MTGVVIWICGLSGAGKTTVAKGLTERLRMTGNHTLLLDGDRLREVLGTTDTHSAEARLQLAKTYGRLCKELADQGAVVVCATISLFHEVHSWNRANIPGYVEVYLSVPLEVLAERDTKGLYAEAMQNNENEVVGMGVDYQEPVSPDLVIENFGDLSSDRAVAMILDHMDNCNIALKRTDQEQ